MTSLCSKGFKASPICILCLVATVLMTPNAVAQQTEILRVDKTNGTLPPPDGSADGTAWQSSAFKFLQDAISKAQTLLDNPNGPDAVDIWVASGTYFPDEDASNPNGSDDDEVSFEMHNDVYIRGGFVGDEQDLGEWDPVTAAPTILSGDLV